MTVNLDTEIRDLTADEINTASGAGLASPTFRLVIFGYGFEFNSRSICIVTPEQDTIINIPR
jgi:hypothetical protein